MEFFEEAFKGYEVPERIKKASKELCTRFNIIGICDPLYICNVIAVESGLGNGCNEFTYGEIINSRKIAERLRGAYGCNIKSKNDEAEIMRIIQLVNDLK